MLFRSPGPEARNSLHAHMQRQRFEQDVKELSERLTGHAFARMTWESDATGRKTAVVWMHGDFEGGRSYTVEVAGRRDVQMRVEREDAETEKLAMLASLAHEHGQRSTPSKIEPYDTFRSGAARR